MSKRHYTRGAPKERFLAKVQKTPEGCWIWRGYTAPNGYGQFAVTSSDVRYAHRFAFEAFSGAIGEGLYVCHRCDVRNCVNPEHLFLGTHQDNVSDMCEKDRHQRGARHAFARLTPDGVRWARRQRRAGRQVKDIAAALQVHRATAGEAIRGVTWKHIADVPPVVTSEGVSK